MSFLFILSRFLILILRRCSYRSYVLPSATSRKRAPSVPLPKAKKAKRGASTSTPTDDITSALLDSVDDLDSLDPALDLSAIELKRRSNTLAARRSRMRKSSHLEMLRDELEEMKKSRDEWRERAEKAEAGL